jgi:hypothetical protein
MEQWRGFCTDQYRIIVSFLPVTSMASGVILVFHCSPPVRHRQFPFPLDLQLRRHYCLPVHVWFRGRPRVAAAAAAESFHSPTAVADAAVAGVPAVPVPAAFSDTDPHRVFPPSDESILALPASTVVAAAVARGASDAPNADVAAVGFDFDFGRRINVAAAVKVAKRERRDTTRQAVGTLLPVKMLPAPKPQRT